MSKGEKGEREKIWRKESKKERWSISTYSKVGFLYRHAYTATNSPPPPKKKRGIKELNNGPIASRDFLSKFLGVNPRTL